MKISILYMFFALQFAYANAQFQVSGDSIDFLERIDSKTFEIVINSYACLVINDSNHQYTVEDYLLLLKINNTMNWYDKDSTYANYYLLRPLIKSLSQQYKIELDFGGMGEAGGEYSKKYNFWMGGYPRASSMFYINDWILHGPITLLFFDCVCAYPPCSE